MSFFTRKPSLGKQGFESGAHKTMENQDLVDGVFEPTPSPSISRTDFAAQGGYRRSNDYSGTTNAAGTAGPGANSIFGSSSSGSLMSNGGRHTRSSTSSGRIFGNSGSSGSIFGSSDPRHSGPEVVVGETPKTNSSNPGMFGIGTNDPQGGPAVAIDRDTSSGSSNAGSNTRSSGNTSIFGSGRTTGSSPGNSPTSAETSSSGSNLGARGSQHTAGSSMTGGRNNAPAPSIFGNSSVHRPPPSATIDTDPLAIDGKMNSNMLNEADAAVRETARDTADYLGNAASSVSDAARGAAEAMSDTGADTGDAASRGPADSVARYTLHGVEGPVQSMGAPATNAVHGTDKGCDTFISCEILPRAENGVRIDSDDARRYGAAGSSQGAGSSAMDSDTRNVKSSVNEPAKEAMEGTGSEILGHATESGLLNAARETGSGVARESVRDDNSSGAAGSILHDTGNYSSSSVNSHRPNPHASTNSGTSGASRLSDDGTPRRGTGPVASTVAAGEPIDKRATIGRSYGNAGHAVGYDVDRTVAEENLRH